MQSLLSALKITKTLVAQLSDSRANVASRSKLVGKQVYNPNGVLVGSVQDVVLPVGEGEVSLQLLSKYRKTEVVMWSNIGAAADIVILKKPMELKAPRNFDEEAATVPPASSPVQPGQLVGGLVSRFKGKSRQCPSCGGNLRWIKQYERWYCDNERRYE